MPQTAASPDDLILNARDATSRAHHPLRTILDGDRIRVEVADTGEGILQENLQDSTFLTTAVGSGTGLGLAVTYGIVQEHGGTIEAKSPNGSGATFVLTLPLGTPAQARLAG